MAAVVAEKDRDPDAPDGTEFLKAEKLGKYEVLGTEVTEDASGHRVEVKRVVYRGGDDVPLDASDPANPATNPGRRGEPVPDAPPQEPNPRPNTTEPNPPEFVESKKKRDK